MLTRCKSEVFLSHGLYPQSRRPDTPIRRLALGILLQALRDLSASNAGARVEQKIWGEDAACWFRAAEHGPGSLKWVCDILQLDYLKILEWFQGFQRSNGRIRRGMVRRLLRMRMPQ